jgi:5-(carboxyamino)imidazole ribonucleotide synthase
VTDVHVGVVGTGQLGWMLRRAGEPLGIRCTLVDPGVLSVAEAGTTVADRHELAVCDVVTVELEAVDVAGLDSLASCVPVRPGPLAVAVAQDRMGEKQHFESAGIPTAAWGASARLPAIVKTRRGGYDGRGQWRVTTEAERDASIVEGGGPDAVVVESVVPFDRELSVIAVRGLGGDVRTWPLVQNDHRDGILRVTRAPAPGLTPALQAEADRLVAALADDLDYVGVLAVELFEVGGHLLANEMACRVHNSGHWTIEAAESSQFENHLRAICGLPLGSTAPTALAAMVNLIGTEPPVASLLGIPGCHVHRYGKAPRPGRKLGHVTVTAPDEDVLAERLAAVLAVVDGGVGSETS